jgi:hypothetical protein
VNQFFKVYEELKSVGILYFWDNNIYMYLFLTVCDNSAGMFLAKSTFFSVDSSKIGHV